MKRMADFIVEKRLFILFFFVALTAASGWLMTRVNVNYDVREYLPAESQTRRGMEIMTREFAPSDVLLLMFEGLSDEEKMRVYHALTDVPNVQAVTFEPEGDAHNRYDYTLYIVTMGIDAFSDDGHAMLDYLENMFAGYDIIISGPLTRPINMLSLLIPALIIMLVILFAMCKSWFEPVILLANIGMAIIINMGTNALFPSISDLTHMIVAVLQLVLSMDYSIIFLNRYRQEKEREPDKATAMKNTIRNSFSTISSISFTTILGMLMLVFMSFTLGRDMGLVIAKGVFISMLCVFAVMPSFILAFDKLLEKRKPSIPFKMKKIASFGYKGRFVMLALFVLLFAGSFLIRGNVEIAYTLAGYDRVHHVFEPNNPLVVLYENHDDENIAALAAQWAENENVSSVESFALITQYLQAMQEMAMAVPPGVELPPEMQAAMAAMADEFRGHFIGETHSRLIINSNFPVESPETDYFIEALKYELQNNLDGEFFVLGESAMAFEMSHDFPGELDFITILTSLAFFIVAAVAFRSFSVSVILVLVIQSAVFITMASNYFLDGSIMYLALIVVQCLIKSRIIDYGILYTSHYIEERSVSGIKEATVSALDKSVHTIMTSGLIMVTVTLGVGIIFAGVNFAVSEILLLVARGCAIGVIITIFILPSLTAVFDRFIKMKKGGKYTNVR